MDMTHKQEQQEHFDRLCHLRGFDPLKRIDNRHARTRPKRSDEVRYEGKAYRVIDVMASPKLELINKVK